MPTLRQRGHHQTLTPLTTSLLHSELSELQRSEKTQWNSNHKHNPSRTNQRHTKRSLKWPLLLHPLGDDLPNVKSKTGPEAVKENTVRDNTTYFMSKEHSHCSSVCVCVRICMWAVHKQDDGLLSSACKKPAPSLMPRDECINPIMHRSELCDICTGEKKRWGANGQHEVSGYGTRVDHANKSTSAVSWDTVDMERPVNDLQVAEHRVQFVLPFEDDSPQGIHNLQRHLPPPHLFTCHFAPLPCSQLS